MVRSADPADPGRPQHRLFLAGPLQVRSWWSLQVSVPAVSGEAVDRCCGLPSEGRRALQGGRPPGVWRGPAAPWAPLQSLQPPAATSRTGCGSRLVRWADLGPAVWLRSEEQAGVLPNTPRQPHLPVGRFA